jgi:S-formylglutathione hydrolase
MTDGNLEKIGSNLSFGGEQLRFKHRSSVLGCDMTFSIYLPPKTKRAPVPVLYWLSGLTCTDENFVNKAGAQQFGAKYGIAIVCPDTSPRGEAIPDDPSGAYDFGLGAGFYLNATAEPWSKNYRMYDYIVDELPALVNSEFALDGERSSISGHSMGGHGALTIALRNPRMYRSVSAFSPICSPTRCPWGQKALSLYLGGSDRDECWVQYDTVELVRSAGIELKSSMPVLIDQGQADNFLADQLSTQLLIDTARSADFPMDIRVQEGYDHSYFFIASFIEEHIAFHASFFE